jgi:threonyl-tRNA synthetase
VLPVSDRHLDYAAQVAERLGGDGLRARVDDRGESIGRKIRDAELAKVPYMLVVGDREAESGTAALRRHREGDLGTLALDDIAQRLAGEAASGYTPSH